MSETISTAVTELFNIKRPILLAGMNVAAGPELAAEVTNNGGLGVIGGVGYTPKFLKAQLDELKSYLNDKNAPFGVDLLLPQVGGSARKTNKDYTGGTLPQLIDIIIESGAKLFVSAVGIPPKWAVDKLHGNGILCMNMIGAPKHAAKALAVGVDIICAQGTEGGGHTGQVATSVLIPMVVDSVRGKKSPLTGKQVPVIAAGGIFDGRGLAMALCLGADAVWVGTRFVAAEEAGAPPAHQKAVLRAGPHDTIRSTIYTGRPMRIIKNTYVVDAEENHAEEIKQFADRGIIYMQGDSRRRKEAGEEWSVQQQMEARPQLMGQASAAIDAVEPASKIMDEMIAGALATLRRGVGMAAKL